MPRLSLPRFLVAAGFLCTLIFLASLNAAFLDTLHNLRVSLPSVSSLRPNYAYPPRTPPAAVLSLNERQRGIKLFFRTWSRHLHSCRPTIPPLELRFGWPAQTVNGQNLALPRRPDRSRLDMSSRDVKLLIASHRTFLGKLGKLNATTARDHPLYSGEGIVMVAGGEFYGPALVTVRMLRRTGCTLPVELFLGSDEEYEPALCEVVFPALGAGCVVISRFLSPPLRKDVVRFQLKSLALLFSSFERLVYLDSDSIPLIDPASLLESKQFRQTGLLLWPDFWTATEDPRFYDIAGVEGGFPSGLPATGCETGQVVLDKTRHLKTLLLAVYYNVWGPKWYYQLLSQGALGQGDKETFLAAAVVLGADWYRVKTNVETLGYRKRRGNEFRATGMMQSWEGKPAFVHANTPKMNAGHLVDEGDLDQGVRLWGTKQETLRRFGYDLERTVWEELVSVGCDLAGVVREWKGRRRLCQRLKGHWERAIERDW